MESNSKINSENRIEAVSIEEHPCKFDISLHEFKGESNIKIDSNDQAVGYQYTFDIFHPQLKEESNFKVENRIKMEKRHFPVIFLEIHFQPNSLRTQMPILRTYGIVEILW